MKICIQKNKEVKRMCPYQASGFCNFKQGMVKGMTECKEMDK